MDSPVEIVIVLVVAALLLGPGRIPVLARSLGEALHEFRRVGDTEESSKPPVVTGPTRADQGRPAAEPADPTPGGSDGAPSTMDG